MTDIVIWGATGYTGRLISKYFATNVSKKFPQLKWSLAGRSREKLQGICEHLDSTYGVKPEVLVADPRSQAELDGLADSSKVVIAAAGPFTTIGTGLVDACVRKKCDYVDITGEVPWVKSISDTYHHEAQQQGVLLTPMCGFDSVPSDLTTLAAVRKLWQVHQEHATKVRSYITIQGTTSGGTIKTGLMLKQNFADEYNDPHLMSRRSGSGVRVQVHSWEADPSEGEWDTWAIPQDGIWTAPFTMGKINTRVVRRSNLLFAEGGDGPSGKGYDGAVVGETPPTESHRFQYSEREVARTEAAAKKIAKNELIPPETVARLVERKRLPQPGQGPSQDQREAAWFQYTTIAEGANGSRVCCKMVRLS